MPMPTRRAPSLNCRTVCNMVALHDAIPTPPDGPAGTTCAVLLAVSPTARSCGASGRILTVTTIADDSRNRIGEELLMPTDVRAASALSSADLMCRCTDGERQ